MKAAVYYGPNKVEVADVPEPSPDGRGADALVTPKPDMAARCPMDVTRSTIGSNGLSARSS